MLRPTALILMLAACVACAGPPGRSITAADYADFEREQAALATSAVLDGDREALDDRVTLIERAAALKRERLEVVFELAELAQRRERLAVAEKGEQSSRELALSQARERLTTQRAEQLFLTDVERPLLLAEDALETVKAEDRLLEVREELAQLEIMYGADPADATAEIVVARSRRRVIHAEEWLRLMHMRTRKLQEIELPKRLHEGALSLQTAEASVADAERALALGDFDLGSTTRALDHDEELLQLQLKDLERREQRLEEDQRGWERGESNGSRDG